MRTSVHHQESPGFWGGLWHALTNLHFITSFFGWFFMLLSRLAEPLMTLSAIYIIICAGIPQWKVGGVYNVGVAIMIAAPEIILPGAFVLAGQYSEHSDKRARMLYWVAWLFVALTFFTLADLFIFHLEGNALNVLMWGRCAVGIAYSILLRVLTQDGHAQPAQQATISASALDYQEIARHLKALFPQPTPAPQMDYQELARQLVPLMPAPQMDYQALKEQLEATCRATIVREITAIRAPRATAEQSTGAGLLPRSQRHLLALESPTRALVQNHLIEAESLAGATLERLQAAYQELITAGGRISGRALAARARCNRATATEWLQCQRRGAEGDPEPLAGATGECQSEPEEASAK